jgi:hypothetical protein
LTVIHLLFVPLLMEFANQRTPLYWIVKIVSNKVFKHLNGNPSFKSVLPVRKNKLQRSVSL